MLTSHESKYSNDVEEEAHCYVVQCRRICYFYIIDRLEQAKPRTAYKLKKCRESQANLLDQGKEHRRTPPPPPLITHYRLYLYLLNCIQFTQCPSP